MIKKILQNCLAILCEHPSFEFRIFDSKILVFIKIKTESILLCKIHDVIGKAEFSRLHSDFQLQPISNVAVVRDIIWKKFVNVLPEL